MKQLIKKIKITTTLKVITGLHIGGNSDNVEIGGIDNPVIKLAFKNHQPYIPGSSLRGKIRCLLEQSKGAVKVGDSDEVNQLFGFSNKSRLSKLIVRDALLTVNSEEQLRKCDSLDMPYIESKSENVIDRVKGTAEHPRLSERVPAGAEFDVEFIINIWEDDNEEQMLNLLKEGINLLEADYLGGSGSRGYGQIKFGTLEMNELKNEDGWKEWKKPEKH